MCLLGAVELTILPAGGLLAQQRRRQPLLHERLAHPVHRGGPAFHGLGNPLVVPTRPARAGIGLEPNPGVDDHGRRPLPGVDPLIQLGAFLSGQTDNVFG